MAGRSLESNAPWRKTTATDLEHWKSGQNRRYYDSTRSRHLSLQQIHKLIIEGYNIRVLEAKTNEDIIPKVLTQILHCRSIARRVRDRAAAGSAGPSGAA